MSASAFDFDTPPPIGPSAEEWQELLEKAIAEMGCSTGTLHRLDPGSGMLELLAQCGIPEELMPKIRSIPIGKGIAGAAAERREAVQLCNLQTDTSGVARPDAKKTEVAGSLAIPLLDGEELLGTIGVGMREPHEFSDTETEKLRKIAAWLTPSFS